MPQIKTKRTTTIPPEKGAKNLKTKIKKKTDKTAIENAFEMIFMVLYSLIASSVAIHWRFKSLRKT